MDYEVSYYYINFTKFKLETYQIKQNNYIQKMYGIASKHKTRLSILNKVLSISLCPRIDRSEAYCFALSVCPQL